MGIFISQMPIILTYMKMKLYDKTSNKTHRFNFGFQGGSDCGSKPPGFEIRLRVE